MGAALRVRSVVSGAGGTEWFALVLDADDAIVAERGGQMLTVEPLTEALLPPLIDQRRPKGHP